MFSFGRKIIKVTFRDHASGAIISAVRMPLVDLPDTFGAGSELKMAGGRYVVVGAVPPSKAEAADTGQLQIAVRPAG